MLQKRFDDNIKSIFLSNNTKAAQLSVALAISGGSDSMAMLHLASNWAKKFNVRLTIFSVNHNLRRSAANEIDFVKKVTLNLGHDFFEFSWNCNGEKSAIQERARLARYDMMTKKCHELNINILLTAHHLDDMLETYIMRKNKKSGILGLSYSMSFFYNNIWIFRPLTIFLKAELTDYLLAKDDYCHNQNEENIKWIEDESNKSDIYERNRIRQFISSLTKIDKLKLIDQMKEVGRAGEKLNEKLINAIAEIVQINNYGFAIIKLAKILGEEFDVKIHIINYLLTIIGGKTLLPRFRSSIQIINKIEQKEKINCSLHGCLLRQTNDSLIIYREASQINTHQIKLRDGAIWDERFIIECNNYENENYTIEHLKLSDYAQIKDELILGKLHEVASNSYRQILFTLPVIKKLEKIVAIPHISYYNERKFIDSLKVTFRPNFISRFTHF